MNQTTAPPRKLAFAGASWATAVSIAALAASRWLDAPTVQYLVIWALATAAAAVLAWRLHGPRRRWALAGIGLLIIGIIIGARAQAELASVTANWTEWQAGRARAGLQGLGSALERAARDLTTTAKAALRAGSDREQAFVQLQSSVAGPTERGVVLYRGDSAYAWAGRLHVSPDNLTSTIGVVASDFYLTLFATARQGSDRAVATLLLSAAPPADRLSRPLSERIAEGAGLNDFTFSGPGAVNGSDPVLHFVVEGQPLLDARAAPLESGEVLQRLTEQLRIRTGLILGAALACFIIAAWRETRAILPRLATLAVVLVCIALVPVNEYSNFTRLFDPTVYFTALGGALTASAGALGLTSAVVLLGLLTVLRRGRQPSWIMAAAILVLVAGLGPFLLRDLARGIRPPTYGVDATLWLIWQIPLFLAAVSVLLAGAGAGGVLLSRWRGLPPWAGSVIAAFAAVLAPIVWQAPGQWPWWYTFLWIAAIVVLALGRQAQFLVVNTAIVAALGASTLVWGRTARGRVELAERDLAALSDPDPQGSARSLLERFAASLDPDALPPNRASLLQHYVASSLAAANYPIALFSLASSGAPVASLSTAAFAVPGEAVRQIVTAALRSQRPVLATVPAYPASEQVLVVPTTNASDSIIATLVAVAPRTRLIRPDPFNALLGLEVEPEGSSPYTLQLMPVEATRPEPSSDARARWQRRESALHGDWSVRTGTGVAHAHVEVELREPLALMERGTLIGLLDLGIVGLLWILSVVADGGFARWLRARRRTWTRSYRLRLTIALFAFFVIPAVAFALWSYQRLSSEALGARDVLVRETLRDVTPGADSLWLIGESNRLKTPLLAYTGGELAGASDPLLLSLAPSGRFLRDDVERLIVIGDEESVSRPVTAGDESNLFGFRSIDRPGAPDLVIAAPAGPEELTIGLGRDDLSVLVLFATAVGAVAALWLSGIAARQLERPIGSLRTAALALAGGERLPPLDAEPTAEFRPVFTAFRRMASDLNASRSALEETQRRIAAILRNVASGVIAVDRTGHVLLANPRADTLLDIALPPRTILADVAPNELTEAVARVQSSQGGDDLAFEMTVHGGQQELRVRLTSIADAIVITLDDVTQVARAQRVLAWGEMARQIAHEIKNPLTPIRLGVQHLRRARADKRVDFDRVLEQNVNRILAEIDRLDEIARSFSRYGAPPNERPRPVPTDIAAVVRDVVGLESMAGEAEEHDAVRWQVEGADAPVTALASNEELREVLLNVFENARLAGAREVAVSLSGNGRPDHDSEAESRVTLVIRDDGHGIPADVLPRIFEPHFSTRTSGSGLGLAISRQIIDSWGGAIAVASDVGQGTTVRIELLAAEPNDTTR